MNRDNHYRYQNDVSFNNLVSLIEDILVKHSEVDPSDLRDAVDHAIDRYVYRLRMEVNDRGRKEI